MQPKKKIVTVPCKHLPFQLSSVLVSLVFRRAVAHKPSCSVASNNSAVWSACRARDILPPETVNTEYSCLRSVAVNTECHTSNQLYDTQSSIAQIPLGSSRLDTTRLGTFDVSSPCFLSVSSLSNSTARRARSTQRARLARHATSFVV